MSNDATYQSPFAEALRSTGISRQTAHRYQALANVPDAVFEDALAGPTKPTTSGVLARAAVSEARSPKPQVSDDALWLWGRLRDFENLGLLDGDSKLLCSDMTDAMRADVMRLAPIVAEALARLVQGSAAPNALTSGNSERFRPFLPCNLEQVEPSARGRRGFGTDYHNGIN